MRVHELASELGIPSKELLKKLHKLGIEAKSHMSSVGEDYLELVREKTGSPESGQSSTADDSSKKETSAGKTPAKKAPEPEPLAEEPEEKKKKPSLEEPEDKDTGDKAEQLVEDAEDQEAGIVTIKGSIIVKDLAVELGIKPNQLIAELMQMNVLASINQKLDINVARGICKKHGYELEQEKRDVEHRAPKKLQDDFEDDTEPENLKSRPPVVTMIGHVDHGKTSLLDQIRKTSVAAAEDGGITQHIGAYTVDFEGRNITFLDTPGHAAFTSMRARGANLTDIAVIVIAADDGIMPQTREAIKHAQAAGVSIMIAINKIDLPAANPDKVRQQLQAAGLSPEEWGGDIICSPVSAETGEGIGHLLEMILLQSEMLELLADYNKRATGFVIESQMEPGMGPTAHLLVKRGTLKVGDALLCGQHCGRVRALINDRGNKIKSATPSTPVKCLGLSGVPEAGAEFRVCSSDKIAKGRAADNAQKFRTEQQTKPRRASLNDLYDHLTEESKTELRVIIKGDTQGSVEAIAQSLEGIESEKVNLNILMAATGNVNANDVTLASASDAIIIGFHVGKETGVNAAARHEGVEIRLHSVIYELIDEVRNAMLGLLAPRIEKTVIGHAKVKQVFNVGKRGKAAGCIVEDGVVNANARVHIKRNDEVIYEGRVLLLKRYQDTVKQVRAGQECGITLESYMNFKEDDIIEIYEQKEVEETL